jgi:hypothetical protein
MRDFKGILQVVIVVALVAIAGLLFSISRKLDSQGNTAAPPATVAPPAPAQDTAAVQPAPVDAAPVAPPPVETVPPRYLVENPKPKKSEVSATERPDRFADLPARTPPPDTTTTPPAPAAAAALPAKDPNGIAYTNDGSTPPITAGLPPPPMPIAPPPPPAPEPKTFIVPVGTTFRVRLIDRIDANKNQTGDTFRASLDENLIVDGTVIANRGSSVVGRLVEDKQASRGTGTASVTLTVEHLSTIGGDQAVSSDVLKKDAQTQKAKDAAKVGGMAALGAVIGALAGHGAGAAIGAGAGAAAGGIDVLATKGKDLKLGPETLLIFRLNAPLTFTADASKVQQASAGTNNNAPTTDPADRPYLRRRNP